MWLHNNGLRGSAGNGTAVALTHGGRMGLEDEFEHLQEGRTMKKLTIMTLVAAAALMLPQLAFAQSIIASATVNSFFSNGAVQNLTFDAVNPGTPASVDVTTGAGGTPGYMEFDYNADYKVVATTLPATLSDGGTSTVTVTWTCGTSVAVGTGPLSSAACAQGDQVASDNTVAAPGTVVVWLGGGIADTNVLAGTYTGNITFTISAF
jgi:hypothetical protein